jgi:hypothetical protein
MEAGASSIPHGAALRAGLYAFLAAFLALLLLVVGIALLFGGGTCAPGGSAEWTAAAGREIPPLYRRVYAAAAAEFELPPAFLAAIGDIESDHGRNPAAQQVNSSGCVGPMQLGVGGACGDFVGAYGKDGNDDGRVDPRNPWDAVFTAANGLREGKGAPPVGEASRDDYYQAACGYYGACAGYASTVMATAERYGGAGWWEASAGGGDVACAASDSPEGKVEVLPGANRPGVPITPFTMQFLREMAGIAGVKAVVSTGTDHSKFTSSGNVSDHWDGHAGDLGTAYNSVRNLDRLCAACLILGGTSPGRAEAMARDGGLWTLEHKGRRIQCIWRSADHYDHLHAAARPIGTTAADP